MKRASSTSEKYASCGETNLLQHSKSRKTHYTKFYHFYLAEAREHTLFLSFNSTVIFHRSRWEELLKSSCSQTSFSLPHACQ